MLRQRLDVGRPQPRHHFKGSLTYQQLAVIVEGDARRLGAVIAIEPRFDQAVEIPNGLALTESVICSVLRGLASRGMSVPCIRMAKDCHKNGDWGNLSVPGWRVLRDRGPGQRGGGHIGRVLPVSNGSGGAGRLKSQPPPTQF